MSAGVCAYGAEPGQTVSKNARKSGGIVAHVPCRELSANACRSDPEKRSPAETIGMMSLRSSFDFIWEANSMANMFHSGRKLRMLAANASRLR